MKQLISVICTVKNGENTISKTLDSVINQVYEDWEMIIVDDGSSDNTELILKDYASKDTRIKLFFSGGIGRGKALNKAIELSSGNYIANIDADDLMHPQRLEYQMEVMENHPVFLISTQTIFIYENETIDWQQIDNGEIQIKQIDKSLLIRNQINHSSVLISKNELDDIGMYNEERKSQLDYDLWLRALLNNKKMLLIDHKFTAKRIHKKQSFENKKRTKYTFNSLLLQLEYLIKSKRYIFLIPVSLASFIMSQLPFKTRRMLSKKMFGET